MKIVRTNVMIPMPSHTRLTTIFQETFTDTIFFVCADTTETIIITTSDEAQLCINRHAVNIKSVSK